MKFYCVNVNLLVLHLIYSRIYSLTFPHVQTEQIINPQANIPPIGSVYPSTDWNKISPTENSNEQLLQLIKLQELSSQLDKEMVQNNTNLPNNSNNVDSVRNINSLLHFREMEPKLNLPQISSIDNRFKENLPNFLNNSQQSSPLCVRREGMLKIRDIDQKDKDVAVTYAILSKDRMSYFVNAKDETSIQGSIELAKISESIKLINGFATCFTIKTIDSVSDCSVCAESEDSAREWINAITQNAVNCNTMSTLNNLNKRGLLR